MNMLYIHDSSTCISIRIYHVISHDICNHRNPVDGQTEVPVVDVRALLDRPASPCNRRHGNA